MEQLKYFTNDKAIEYKAMCDKVNWTLIRMDELNIDVTKEKEEFEAIDSACSESVQEAEETSDDLTRQFNLETIYNENIKKLENLRKRLKEQHESYVVLYNRATQIQNQIKDTKFIGDTMGDYASAMINLLEILHSTDTRPYGAERKFVEKVYNVAYSVMELELLQTGESRVLEWVKTKDTINDFMNNIVQVKIAVYSDRTIALSAIAETMEELKSQGTNASYLQKELILYLALRNRKTANAVKEELKALLNCFDDGKKDATNKKNKIADMKRRVNYLLKDIKDCQIHKQIAVMLSLVALLFAGKYGFDRIIKLVGYTGYRSEITYYYSNNGGQIPRFPEYMKKVDDDYDSTRLIVHGLWNREKLFYGDYEREVRTYYLDNKDVTSMQDVEKLNWFDWTFRIRETMNKEKRENVDPSELYSEAIAELVRIKQDQQDKKFVPNDELQEKIGNVFMLIAVFLLCLGEYLSVKSICEKLSRKGLCEHEYNELLEELQVQQEAYDKLCAENEDFRLKFIDAYERVARFIKDKDLEKGYKGLVMKPIPKDKPSS